MAGGTEQASLVDMEDGLAKCSISNNFSLQHLGVSPMFSCRGLPLDATGIYFPPNESYLDVAKHIRRT